MPNTSSICPSVLIVHQLVSDRQTTGHASIVSCRKKCAVPLYNTSRDLGKYISWYDSNRLARFWFFVVINAVVNFGYIVQIRCSDVQMPSVLWRCWLGGRKGRLKMRDMKIRDGQKCRGGKCETWKCGTKLQGWKMREKLVWKAKVKKCLKVVVFVCTVIPSV